MDRKTVDLYRSKDPIVSLFMFCRIIHGYLPNIFFCELYKCDGIIITAPLTSWKGSLLQRHTPVPPLWYRVSWPLFPSSQLHHIDDCFTMTIVHSQRVVKFYNIRLWISSAFSNMRPIIDWTYWPSVNHDSHSASTTWHYR